ncbi:hypothetical protein F5Y03DRAFT_290630 [Xylaria venustula]|nr:hypothetical protein F5Y03DRAFT_290630 [Xylaria venustula]
MSSNYYYRIYIRFGENNCVRLLAHGEGKLAKDGRRLFQWIRDPANIARLRNGLQHVYELHEEELDAFLKFKEREDPVSVLKQRKKYQGLRGGMLAALKLKRNRFKHLRDGIGLLEDLANTAEITVLPRVYLRTISDRPGWLYLLDLEQETLEIHWFGVYIPPSSARPTLQALYEASPDKSPSYYIKLKFLELQRIWRNEWVKLCQVHIEMLNRLWRRNARVLQTTKYADAIPFPVLYGSIVDGHDGKTGSSRRPRRLTQEKLTEVLANLKGKTITQYPGAL